MIKVLAIWDINPNVFSMKPSEYRNRGMVNTFLINSKNVVFIELVDEHEQHKRGYSAIVHTVKEGALYVQENNNILEQLAGKDASSNEQGSSNTRKDSL
jgi:hypothetical protein